MQSRTSLRIDAHHHLWHFTPEYDWIGDDMRALRRDFLVDELRSELRRAGVDAAIAVQARQSLQETDWLLSLAAEPDSPIGGVVGWLPLAADDLPAVLDRYRGAEKLKGVRHIVQAEAAGFLDSKAFNRGIRALQGTGLVYEILVHASQLAEVISFVDRHPNQTFVLDHLGKPPIRQGAIHSWSPLLRELGQRPNLACKLSGLVTEADFDRWTPETLQPYMDVALEAFGSQRLMIGTDWPVLTVACTYTQWWHVVQSWVSALSSAEQAGVLGETAMRWYSLGSLGFGQNGR